MLHLLGLGLIDSIILLHIWKKTFITILFLIYRIVKVVWVGYMTSMMIYLLRLDYCRPICGSLMNQSMWIIRVPSWVDPGDYDIWKFLLSKSPPSFSPFVSESPLFPTPEGGNLFYFKCQNCSWVRTPLS